MICNSYIFINSNFISYKNWTQSLEATIFAKKYWIFVKKVLATAKFRTFIYLWTTFQVFSLILTSIRHRVVPPTSQIEPLKIPASIWLNWSNWQTRLPYTLFFPTFVVFLRQIFTKLNFRRKLASCTCILLTI